MDFFYPRWRTPPGGYPDPLFCLFFGQASGNAPQGRALPLPRLDERLAVRRVKADEDRLGLADLIVLGEGVVSVIE